MKIKLRLFILALMFFRLGANARSPNVPTQCAVNDLAIFKVLIPFMGEPSRICFCVNADSTPALALCKIEDGGQLINVISEKSIRPTLDSACKATSLDGGGVACLCSQKYPKLLKDYIRCLHDNSKVTAPIPDGGTEDADVKTNR